MQSFSILISWCIGSWLEALRWLVQAYQSKHLKLDQALAPPHQVGVVLEDPIQGTISAMPSHGIASIWKSNLKHYFCQMTC